MGRDWRLMARADFDASAPLALTEVRSVRAGGEVPAVPDAYGTDPLFGEEAPVRRVAVRRVRGGSAQGNVLF
jgi:hypothetical protein